MIAIHDLNELMRDLNAIVAPMSDSPQWQAWVEDCRRHYGKSPWVLSSEGVEVDEESDFAKFWLAVADQDYEVAEQYGEVPEGWK